MTPTEYRGQNVQGHAPLDGLPPAHQIHVGDSQLIGQRHEERRQGGDRRHPGGAVPWLPQKDRRSNKVQDSNFGHRDGASES